MITKFKKGDLVPEWVLRAPAAHLQKEATFSSDVTVNHGENNSGPVTVSPTIALNEDESLCYITEEGSVGEWVGAPTRWLREVIH